MIESGTVVTGLIDPPHDASKNEAAITAQRLQLRSNVALISGLQVRLVLLRSLRPAQGLPSSGTSTGLLSSPIRIRAIYEAGARPWVASALVCHVTSVVCVAGSYTMNVLKPLIWPLCP